MSETGKKTVYCQPEYFVAVECLVWYLPGMRVNSASSQVGLSQVGPGQVGPVISYNAYYFTCYFHKGY